MRQASPDASVRSMLVLFSFFLFLGSFWFFFSLLSLSLLPSQLCSSSCSTLREAVRPRLSVRLALGINFDNIKDEKGRETRIISQR